MPDMDGWQTIKALRARWPQLPVAVLSGEHPEDAEPDLAAARRFGILHTLRKPFQAEDLASLVETALTP